jgi:hypothetical protein
VEDKEKKFISKGDIDFAYGKDGVDAIKLNLSKGDYELYYELYGWDCDSILIMNPDIIRPL